MKEFKIIMFVALGLLLVLNIPPAKQVLMLRNADCSYSNYSGTFTFEEMDFELRNLDMCLRKFKEFKKNNTPDSSLYRLCKKNYWQFWNYGSYLFDKKFKLPYMPWSEIKKRRGPLILHSGFQDF